MAPARKAEIDERLARLQALSDDHFEVHPDEVTWSDVADLARHAELLQQITDIAFNEGEHAPEPAEPKRTRMAPVPGNPMPLVHEARRIRRNREEGNPFTTDRAIKAQIDALTEAYLRCGDARRSELLKVEIDLLEMLI
jgi:hypothetical protein